jgi:hypothetical protein
VTEVGVVALSVFWIGCGLVAQDIGRRKGVTSGLWFGLLLGPVGLVIVGLMNPTASETEAFQIERGRRVCPFCAEWIKREAVVCRFCARNIEPMPPLEATPGDCGCGAWNVPGAQRCCRCHKRLNTA